MEKRLFASPTDSPSLWVPQGLQAFALGPDVVSRGNHPFPIQREQIDLFCRLPAQHRLTRGSDQAHLELTEEAEMLRAESREASWRLHARLVQAIERVAPSDDTVLIHNAKRNGNLPAKKNGARTAVVLPPAR